MNTQKYIDIAYQNPRGKLIKACIEKHWSEWEFTYNKHEVYMIKSKKHYTGSPEEIYIKIVWYLGYLELKDCEILRDHMYIMFDNWLEQLLVKVAKAPSTRFIIDRHRE